MLRDGQGPRLRAPSASLFDSWYSGLENLKAVRGLRLDLPDAAEGQPQGGPRPQGYRAVAEVAIAAGGTVVHLEGFGSIRVFKVVSRDGDIEYWATNDLAMDELTRLALRRAVLGDRELSPGPEAVLRRGAVPGAGRAGAAQPHRAGDPGVPAAGAPFLHHRGQLVRGEGSDHPRRGAGLHRQSGVQPAMTA